MTLFEAFVYLVLLLPVVYFVGRLVWLVGMILWVLTVGQWRQRALLASEIAGLNSEQIRERLLDHGYFTTDLRRQPAIDDFLSRLAKHDEVALRRKYSRRRLYSMLCACERAAGRRGRPNAVDYVDELHALLDALAKRAGPGVKEK